MPPGYRRPASSRCSVLWASLMCAVAPLTGTCDRPSSVLQEALVTDATSITASKAVAGSVAKLGLNATTRSHASVNVTVNLHSKASERVQARQAQLVEAEMRAQSQMIGAALGAGKDMMKLMAVCAICIIGYKLISSIDCNTRKLDCRRFKCLGRFLLWLGWDEFESSEVMVQIHSVGDVKKDGMLGEKEYKVILNFFWSKFETGKTKDMRWEQVKGMEIPQGASSCHLRLYSCGKFKDSLVAEVELDTMKDILSKPEETWWSHKQKFKMEAKGKIVGTLSITFRKKSADGSGDLFPITGIDEDSALAMEVMKWKEEDSEAVHSPHTCNQCQMAFMRRKEEKEARLKKCDGKFTGDDELTLLAQILTGPLRLVDEKSGKESEVQFIKVVHCNLAELSGDNSKEVMQQQLKKAKDKGIQGVERKWYWCMYEDKKKAERQWEDQAHAAKMDHPPDEFFLISSLSSISRSPEREDQFVIKYHSEGEKNVLIYRREKGMNREVWVEGLELFARIAREEKDGEKRKKEIEDELLNKMKITHQHYIKANGKPKTDADWSKWTAHMRKGYPGQDPIITRLFQEEKRKLVQEEKRKK